MPKRRPHLYPSDRSNRLQNAETLAASGSDEARQLQNILNDVASNRLPTQGVPPPAWILVKHACDDLESALDYIAVDLWERYCEGPLHKVYFPIAKLDESEDSFRRALAISWPGLANANSVAHSLIVSIQHFGRPDFGWLYRLRDLNQVLKHPGAPQHRARIVPFTAQKEGYVTESFKVALYEMEGFDGDLGGFLQKASEALSDFARRMADVLQRGEPGLPPPVLMDIAVNGDVHKEVRMRRQPG